MTHFARVYDKRNPANRLHKYLLAEIERLDCLLCNDVPGYIERIESLTNRANRLFHRCTPIKTQPNRGFQINEMTSITAIGVCTVRFHPVDGWFFADSPKPVPLNFTDADTREPVPQIPADYDEEEEPSPVYTEQFGSLDDRPSDDPATEPAEEGPRTALFASRTDHTILSFISFKMLSAGMQKLIKAEKIWAIYKRDNGEAYAEEYGGLIHPLLFFD